MASSALLLILAIAISAHAASIRSPRTTRSPSTTTTSADSTSWSKKIAVTAKPETAALPFVTSRVERVPRPEKPHKRKTSRGSFIAPSRPLRSENAIDHGAPLPTKRKSKQQGSSRRWGESALGSYDPFSNGGSSEPYYRQIVLKQNSFGDGSYHRGPSFDPTASVRSPTIAVSPIRYKIIDMGDPWVRWPQSTNYGYDPHRRRPEEADSVGLYRQDSSSYHNAPIYGYRQPQQPYGADESAAYSDVQESYMDPFRQYGARDTLPWSVQVGTSLTVKDDGRQSRRRYYVNSQKNTGYDDFNG